MKQTLYNCHTEGSDFRITKFVDGDVESSYLCSVIECECPAGHRSSCRHRQMLPNMIAHGIVNTHWFFNFDTHRVVDFSGELKSNLDALNELAAHETDHIDWDTMAEERLGQRPVGEAQHTEVTIAHSITLSDNATSEEVAQAFAGIQQQAKPWRRL